MTLARVEVPQRHKPPAETLEPPLVPHRVCGWLNKWIGDHLFGFSLLLFFFFFSFPHLFILHLLVNPRYHQWLPTNSSLESISPDIACFADLLIAFIYGTYLGQDKEAHESGKTQQKRPQSRLSI